MTIMAVQKAEAQQVRYISFKKIFIDPYEDNSMMPFVAGVESRGFLYPVIYTMDQQLFRALKEAALLVGDDSFYLSILDDVVEEGAHWIIPLNYPDYFRFQKEHSVSENAVYSPQGKWGILFYDDCRAVIGGTKEFVSKFFELLPPSKKEECLKSFLDDYNKYYERCLMFLTHLYGKEKALSLLRQYLSHP